jgi:hypothetical protein
VDQGSPVALTGILKAWSGGDAEALERLTPIVYAELHRLARISMSREREGHLMQSTLGAGSRQNKNLIPR